MRGCESGGRTGWGGGSEGLACRSGGGMATERKREQVALLEERLGRASITIGIDYRGLSVKDMQQLRRAIRAEAPETELRVIKNTLWRRASEGAGEAGAADLAQESTAMLFGFGDLTEAPRALQKYTREKPARTADSRRLRRGRAAGRFAGRGAGRCAQPPRADGQGRGRSEQSGLRSGRRAERRLPRRGGDRRGARGAARNG